VLHKKKVNFFFNKAFTSSNKRDIICVAAKENLDEANSFCFNPISQLDDFNSKGKKMNKTELVQAIANGSGITKVSAGKVLEVFMTTVTEALKSGDQVVLPGFGSFKTRLRSAYAGRNPQTGKEIQIKAARVANFKAGKNLKEAVQEVK